VLILPHGFDALLEDGVVAARGDKIAMWLCDSKQGESILKIGTKLKERLGIDAKVKLGFEAHQDTMNKSGSTAKNKYVV
jgi:translation initiation factor 4E